MNGIYGGVLGLCTGDALGVSVEFRDRAWLAVHPVTEMIGGGFHGMRAGTWSDDSSLALCLLDSLTRRGAVDCRDIMERFLSWAQQGEYTPHGQRFGMGKATAAALERFAAGTPAESCGCTGERENGNGSLMRILPLAFFLYARYGTQIQWDGAMELIHRVSALTHAHPRSLIACGLYVSAAAELLEGSPLDRGLRSGIAKAWAWYEARPDFAPELEHFLRVRDLEALAALPEEEIASDGYVVHTLEAALWCLLTTGSFEQCVCRAVNLGSDTDTVAAVAGGLAGIYYGKEAIPRRWLDSLARREWIEGLCSALSVRLDDGSYQGNELYRYLRRRGLTGRYFCTPEKTWTLLYSNKDTMEPVLLCFARQVNDRKALDEPYDDKEREAYLKVRAAARQMGLPLLYLRFYMAPGQPMEFWLGRPKKEGGPVHITPAQFLQLLRDMGLDVAPGQAEKQVNSATSSSFHDWQRTHMGDRVNAIDLDLMEFQGDRLTALYELKRSVVSLDAWAPYPDDYPNYVFQSKAARRAGVELRVIYNMRRKKPYFYDDISRLKLFRFDHTRSEPVECLGQWTAEDCFKPPEEECKPWKS